MCEKGWLGKVVSGNRNKVAWKWDCIVGIYQGRFTVSFLVLVVVS